MASLCAQEYYYYKNDAKVQLEKVTTTLRVNAMFDYYKNNMGVILGVSDKIILKLKLHDNLDKYSNLYDYHVEKEMGNNLYLLKVKDKSLTLKVANELSKQKDVIYAQPDFVKKSLRR